MSISGRIVIKRNPIVFRQSSGWSESANAVLDLFDELQPDFDRTITFGDYYAKMLENLLKVKAEHSIDNWDGYDAKAINDDSYKNAWQFALSLPPNLPIPEIYVEPDGEVTFEWYEDKREVFSISIGRENKLAYAGLYGANKTYGVEDFYDDIPDVILSNIYRLHTKGMLCY
jgi:hypothetical protein